jgi:hypothetical protein
MSMADQPAATDDRGAEQHQSQPQLVVVNLAPLGPTARARLEPRLGVADPHQIQGQEVTLSLPPCPGSFGRSWITRPSDRLDPPRDRPTASSNPRRPRSRALGPGGPIQRSALRVRVRTTRTRIVGRLIRAVASPGLVV